MAQDDLKDKSQKSPLDRLASYGTAALALGAGAAVFYRGGGNKALSEVGSIARRTLMDASERYSKLDMGNLTSTDLKNFFHDTFESESSGIRKAVKDTKEQKLRVRFENPRNLINGLDAADTTFSHDGFRIRQRDYLNREVYYPFVKKTLDNLNDVTAKQKRNVETFIHSVTDDLDDISQILNKAKATKADQTLNEQQIQQIQHDLKERVTAGKNNFKKQKDYGKSAIDEAIRLSEDVKVLEQKFGSKTAPTKEQKAISKITGDRALTVNEMIANAEKFSNQFMLSTKSKEQESKRSKENVIDYLKRKKELQRKKYGEEAAKKFGDLFVDGGALRINDKGEIISYADSVDLLSKTIESFGSTMPGKIAKVVDILDRRRNPNIFYSYSGPGRVDPILASATGNRKDGAPVGSFLRLFDKTYRYTPNGLEHVKELDNTYLVSRYDSMSGLINKMAGNTAYIERENKVLNGLDILQDGQMTVVDKLRTSIGKFDDKEWIRNIVNDFSNHGAEEIEKLQRGLSPESQMSASDVNSYIRQIRSINNFYSKNSYASDTASIHKIADASSGKAKEIFNLLKMNDEDLIQTIISSKDGSLGFEEKFMNQDLVSLLKKYEANPKRANDMINIKNDRQSTNDLFGNQNETEHFMGTLRMELEKEGYMKTAAEDGQIKLNRITKLLEDASLGGDHKRSARGLADWSIFQLAGEVNSRFTRGKSVEDLNKSAQRAISIITRHDEVDGGNAAETNAMADRLKAKVANKTSVFDTDYDEHLTGDDSRVEVAGQSNEWMYQRKGITPLSNIEGLNTAEKLKAFGKQFVAGRKNMNDVTSFTMLPYFFLSRLSDPLASIGLSFSNQNTGSSVDLAKAIILKRTLPIVGAVYGYQYFDDLSKATTGTGISEAFLTNMANADLTLRGIADATGIGDFIQSEKEINPMLRYFTGNDYQDEDERRDYYQNGYTAMRKGRWWSFGSTNEFRGSRIEYFQPNMLRRVTSDYKDKAIYNGFLDKWSHSLMPTPTNPLSPLNAVLDPYWMERRFYDERPYPMTGKMFSEETPWGPALNATVGQIIKPQKKMHQDRLNSHYQDVRAIIEQMNEEQFNKSKEKDGNLVRFKDGAIEPVDFTGYNAPTLSERVLQARVGADGIQSVQGSNYGVYTGVESGQEYMAGKANAEAAANRAIAEGDTSGGSGVLSTFGGGDVTDISLIDKINLSADGGNVISKLLQPIANSSKEAAVGTISDLNYDILMSSRAYRPTHSKPKERGVITTESIYKTSAKFGQDVLDDEDAISDLRGLTTGDDFIGEMAYSARFVTGIYGYGSSLVAPGGEKTKLADAGDITSPIRSFWDLNTGGIGGEAMEIFRRFIPSSNYKQNDFNPLMNKMPDWMPEKFRFGDPYTILPKGEMRLPGRGYEAINELHPDAYGEYGAFDRFKILADIAPQSSEYKIWRDIAKKTVGDDPTLKDQMDQIKDRVKEQGKKYDFYNYNFIGNSIERKKATVDEIIDNNYFTVVGDSRVYRFAGVNLSNTNHKDESKTLTNGKAVYNYLHPGDNVVLGTDKNEVNGQNDDEYQSISAAVYLNGESIGHKMLEDGYGEARLNDMSAAADIGKYTDFQRLRGTIYEAIAHAPIPLFQQKFMKIRDPLESYKNEFVYGTSYSSWNRPIDSFLMPAIQRSLMSDNEILLGSAAALLNEFVYRKTDNKHVRMASNALMALTNRGAFIGGFLGKGIGFGEHKVRRGAQIGAALQVAGWAITRKDQPIEETIGGAAIGAVVGHALKDIGIKKGALVGATVGSAISSQFSNVLSDHGLDKKYIPKTTKKNWDMEEYFDRMEYIKYKGMYEKAARLAKRKENVDVKKLVDDYESNREHNRDLQEKLLKYKEQIAKAYSQDSDRGWRLLHEIDSKLDVLKESQFHISVGQYAKSALMYKQAMDSTIYGLKDDATWAQTIRATPTNKRDHFMEFAKVKDPEKRKEILRYVSPYEAKILKVSWGEKIDKQESNNDYFKHHFLPKPTWSGWRPNVDLKDVEVKTIQNEGLLLSDFGYYESQLRDKKVINAPNLKSDKDQSAISAQLSLEGALKGMGLTGVNVNIVPSSTSGIQMIANIAQVAGYNIQQKIGNLFSF